MKIGSKIKIPNNLKVDPLNKKGQTGTLISDRLGIYTIRFSDGKEGKFFASVWKKFAKGGKVDENAEMVLNQNTQIKHHTEELKSVVKAGAEVPAWVVAKVNRSANDISDATHYLQGETKMAKGGNIFDASNTPITFNVIDGEKIVLKTKSLNKASDYITLNGKHLSLESVDSKGNTKKLMAKGGNIKYYTKDDSYRLSRPSGSIEKDILEKITFKESVTEKDFVGNFGWKTPQGKLGDGYLFRLDEYDQNLIKDLKLKSGEKVFRYFNRLSAIGGMTPLIKMNLEKGLIYFLQDNDKEDIVFETRGTNALWISLIEDKMAKGGYINYRGTITDDALKSILSNDFPSANYRLDYDSINGMRIYAQKEVLGKIQIHLINEYAIQSKMGGVGTVGLPYLSVENQVIDKMAKGGKVAPKMKDMNYSSKGWGHKNKK